MTRLLLSLAGVVLLAVVALAIIWLTGQLLVGVGALAVGTAGVLLRLLWFLIVALSLGGLVFFVSNAWRPTHQLTTPSPLPRPEPIFPVQESRPSTPAHPQSTTSAATTSAVASSQETPRDQQ